MLVDENCLIDLHLHLDGSISVSSARKLATMSGIILPESDEELKNQLLCPSNCRNLNEYLERFALPGKLMQTRETLEASTFYLCEELKKEGLIYAEIRFAPQKHCEKGLSQEQVVQAAIAGMKRSSLDAQLILCCMRDGKDNKTENMETVRVAKKYLGDGVCACDLAGAEGLFPNERYVEVFAYAKKLGIPCTIHSGEASGAESVKKALELGASRIGHGVRAKEDPAVLQELIRRKIPLEICPTSNVNTCVFKEIHDIPIQEYMENGVIVTINSDNMSVSNTNVRKELQHVVDAFHLNKKDVKQLLRNSVKAAFTSDEEKKKLEEKIQAEFCKELL